MANLGNVGVFVDRYYDVSGSPVSMPFPDKRLALANSMWAAKMSWSSSWNTLMVTVRCSVEDTGLGRITGASLNVFGPSAFYCGLMSTPSSSMINGPLTLSSSHFVGLKTIEDTWTRTTGTSRVWFDIGGTANGSYVILKKTGSSELTQSISTAQWAPAGDLGTPEIPSVFCLFFFKQADHFSCSAIYNSSVGGFRSGVYRPHQVESIACLAAVSSSGVDEYIESFSNATNYITTTSSYFRIPVDEANDGYLDSICLAWDRSWPRMCISEIMWSKIN